jgi:hypothetical protein
MLSQSSRAVFLLRGSMERRRFLSNLLAAGGLTALDAVGAMKLRGSTWEPDLAEITQVLVMFKCHLDVGFDNTQAAILRLYFDQYFPKAIEIAEETSRADVDRYVWTTGSWMLYEYLEQASAEQRKRAEQAIASGHLAWHALPFTWQSEMLDQTMITGAIGLSKALDRRFGRTTTGAKMTDVPGHTRGIIGPLAQNGVTFLHLGINSASTPAEVPPLFRWKDADDNELTVMYHRDYGGNFELPGSSLAVAIEVKDDNLGPHTRDELSAIYQKLRARYPHAKITPATLTDIARAIAPYRSQLPVCTQEIGDTWIHGVPSDPIKVSRYRELARLRREWIAAGKIHSGDSVDLAFLRRLTLAVEHGNGADTKQFLDYDHYKPRDLARVLSLPGYTAMTTSWAEKRHDIDESVASLPASLRSEAVERLHSLTPEQPIARGLKPQKAELEMETKHFVVSIDPQTGALCGLREKSTGRTCTSSENPFAVFSYQTFSKEDFEHFIGSYIRSTEDWAFKDFGKPGIERFGARSRSWTPRLVDLRAGVEHDAFRLLAELRILDPDAEELGTVAWPQKMFLELILPDAEPTVQMNFSWFGKIANRLPEAAWLSFFPTVTGQEDWTLEKTDQLISPFEVVRGGNRHMHAVTRLVRRRDARVDLVIETLDAPVVALGEKTPLFFSTEQPDLRTGLHFCLHNNSWGTNYPQWFGEDMRFRFILRTQAGR